MQHQVPNEKSERKCAPVEGEALGEQSVLRRYHPVAQDEVLVVTLRSLAEKWQRCPLSFLRSGLGPTAFRIWRLLVALRDRATDPQDRERGLVHITDAGVARLLGGKDPKRALSRLRDAGLLRPVGVSRREGLELHGDLVDGDVFLRRVLGADDGREWVAVPVSTVRWLERAKTHGGRRPRAGRPAKPCQRCHRLGGTRERHLAGQHPGRMCDECYAGLVEVIRKVKLRLRLARPPARGAISATGRPSPGIQAPLRREPPDSLESSPSSSSKKKEQRFASAAASAAAACSRLVHFGRGECTTSPASTRLVPAPPNLITPDHLATVAILGGHIVVESL